MAPRRGLGGRAGAIRLYTLKALAFIHLKREDRARAGTLLEALAVLDPNGLVGWRVVADLAKGWTTARPRAAPRSPSPDGTPIRLA